MVKKTTAKALSPWRDELFAAALVERMAANFMLFCEVSGHEGADIYRKALDCIWETLAHSASKVDFEKQLEKVEQVTPVPEDYDFYGVWPALDACVGLSMLLESRAELALCPREEFIQLSQATIAGYLDVTGFEGDIQQHALYADQSVFCQQVDDLIAAHQVRKGAVLAVKALVQSQAVSNIGLEFSSAL